MSNYLLLDLRRVIRRPDTLMFILVLPVAMFLVFGVAMPGTDAALENGNVAAYVMISMALYGAVTAAATQAANSAVENRSGWGRQIALTDVTTSGYLIARVAVGAILSVLPVMLTFLTGAAVGAHFDQPALWALTAIFTVVFSLPFSLIGLLFAQLIRSEAAVSITSGIMVLLAFAGNLFFPLGGTLLDISRFTPLYGAGALARWPLTKGQIPTIDALTVEPLWIPITNLACWTILLIVACALAAKNHHRR